MLVQPSLYRTWSETPKDRFFLVMAHILIAIYQFYQEGKFCKYYHKYKAKQNIDKYRTFKIAICNYERKRGFAVLTDFFGISLNQRTNGPVNAHLISGPIQNLDKMTEKTLTLITNNPQLTHSVYNINLILGHRM